MVPDDEGLTWQIQTWNQMADLYVKENAPRMAPVVENVVSRAALCPGEHVLDIGTGTGGIIERAAPKVGSTGHVLGIDISANMLHVARQQLSSRGFTNFSLREAAAESLPADAAAFDVVLASLSMMYVVDRATAAREIARVLRPGGRFVAAVWAGPQHCDLVRFQQIAGRFAGPPPVPGVGPGALADPSTFLEQLNDAGVEGSVDTQMLGFSVGSFALAWAVFAGVTTAKLSPERQQEARDAVRAEMWPDGEGARDFRNLTQFVIGHRRA
jgi:SAM-dependent methyltransferase